MVKHDLVIRNGFVVDGSGLDAYRADVGVVGDRIATIGRIAERGDAEIDAEGHVVTPGFIDCHTHLDAQMFWDPQGANSCWHGVTSAVMGNCGFTLAPCKQEDADFVFRNLERAEDIAREAMLEGVEWQWETFPEYLDAVDAQPKGINYAGYIGHSALRTYVMGNGRLATKPLKMTSRPCKMQCSRPSMPVPLAFQPRALLITSPRMSGL